MSDAQELIGVDVGLKKSGIARASTMAKLAEPLKTIQTEQLLDELAKLTAQKLTEAVVIGLPRNLNGEDTEQTTWVRNWAQQAKQKLSTPLYWQDEALTTKLANKQLAKTKTAAEDDALAAAIILQDFIDTSPANRVLC